MTRGELIERCAAAIQDHRMSGPYYQEHPKFEFRHLRPEVQESFRGYAEAVLVEAGVIPYEAGGTE